MARDGMPGDGMPRDRMADGDPPLAPDNPAAITARMHQAMARHQAGDLAAAIAGYRAVHAVLPDHVTVNHLLGVALHRAGATDDARRHLVAAAARKPDSAEIRFNLARADHDTGRLAEAEAGYRAAIAVQADFAPAHLNLADLLLDRGAVAAGLAVCRQAVALAPDNPAGHVSLGTALAQTGDHDGARQAFEAALALQPDHGIALVNLGRLAERQQQPAAARDYFRRAAAAAPTSPTAIAVWSHQLRRDGRIEAARRELDAMLARRWTPTMALLQALCLPVIQDGGAAIDRERARLDGALDRLLDPPAGRRRTLPLDSMPFEVSQTLFHLAYHGRDDRALHEKAIRVLLAWCPDLAGPGVPAAPARRSDGRIHVGIASRHLHGHTIGHLNRGLVEHLSRDRFRITLFRFADRDDAMAARINAAADAVQDLPLRLSAAHRAITAAGIDVLFFPDVGMDPFTWFLAMARLAPLHCCTWGHPVTTGMPSMDLFLSGRDIEPAADEPGGPGDRYYSERLVRLDTPVPYVYRPSGPAVPPAAAAAGAAARAALGLPADRRLYVCPQSLFKLHPDFDPVLGRILDADPAGEIVLIEGEAPYWADRLRRRFARAFPAAVGRVRFLPRLPHRDFMLLVQAADVLLDPPRFGGGKSSLEMFAAGRAVVTWPGPLLRDRLTHGFYRMMDIDAGTVRDGDAYAALAVALATDRDRRAALEADIVARRDVLFENRGWIRQVESVWGG